MRKHFLLGAKGSRKGRVRAVLWKNNFEQPRTPHDLRTCSFQSSESCSAAPAFKAIGAKKMVALALRYPAFIHLHVTFSSRNCLPLYVANCLQAFDLLDGLADLARGTYPDISVGLGFTQGADPPQPLLSLDLGLMGSYESWQLRGGHSRLSTEIFSPLFTSIEGVYIFLVSLVMCYSSSSLVSAPCYTSSMYTPWKTTISVFFSAFQEHSGHPCAGEPRIWVLYGLCVRLGPVCSISRCHPTRTLSGRLRESTTNGPECAWHQRSWLGKRGFRVSLDFAKLWGSVQQHVTSWH
jgi:hypothetical protein